MNILILGDGEEEVEWARWFLVHPPLRVIGIYPGFSSEVSGEVGVGPSSDFEAALALPDVDLAVVGGPSEFRMEALRRVAALGWPAISLHPPGPDSEAYYQVSLSREETGAVIVPDLPLRLHPAISRIKQTLGEGVIGKLLTLHFTIPINAADQDLAREVFPKIVDVVRAVAGEVEAVWAIGQPPRESPSNQLSVYLDMTGGARAQVSIQGLHSDVLRSILQCEQGTLTFEHNPSSIQPSRLNVAYGDVENRVIEFEDWDPHEEIFAVLLRSLEKRDVPASALPSPNLDDGIRAMELTEAVVRSLKRERKISLHYQSIGEEANFKSVMTSTGCLVLLGILFILPLALAGGALGMPWLIYLSYLIPILLVVFILLQSLRLAVRKPSSVENSHDPQVAHTTGNPVGM